MLERGGVIVQVADRIDELQTDLSDLLAKRVAKPILDEGRANGTRKQAILQPVSSNLPRTPVQAVYKAPFQQQKSPFEQRQAEYTSVAWNDRWKHPASSKRLRRDDSHIPLFQILRTSKPLRARNSDAAPEPAPRATFDSTLQRQASRTAAHVSTKRSELGQGKTNVKETLDLNSSAISGDHDHDEGSAIAQAGDRHNETVANDRPDATRNRRPPPNERWSQPSSRLATKEKDQCKKQANRDGGHKWPPKTRVNETRLVAEDLTPLPVPHQATPRTSEKSRPVRQEQQNMKHIPAPASSPSVSTTNHLPSLSKDPDKPANDAQEECHHRSQVLQDRTLSRTHDSRDMPKGKEDQPAKPLRFISQNRRKTLLCQSDDVSSNKPPKKRRPKKGPKQDRKSGRHATTSKVIEVERRPTSEPQQDHAAEATTNQLEQLLWEDDHSLHHDLTPGPAGLISRQSCEASLQAQAPKWSPQGRDLPPHARLDAELLFPNVETASGPRAHAYPEGHRANAIEASETEESCQPAEIGRGGTREVDLQPPLAEKTHHASEADIIGSPISVEHTLHDENHHDEGAGQAAFIARAFPRHAYVAGNKPPSQPLLPCQNPIGPPDLQYTKPPSRTNKSFQPPRLTTRSSTLAPSIFPEKQSHASGADVCITAVGKSGGEGSWTREAFDLFGDGVPVAVRGRIGMRGLFEGYGASADDHDVLAGL